MLLQNCSALRMAMAALQTFDSTVQEVENLQFGTAQGHWERMLPYPHHLHIWCADLRLQLCICASGQHAVMADFLSAAWF